MLTPRQRDGQGATHLQQTVVQLAVVLLVLLLHQELECACVVLVRESVLPAERQRLRSIKWHPQYRTRTLDHLTTVDDVTHLGVVDVEEALQLRPRAIHFLQRHRHLRLRGG